MEAPPAEQTMHNGVIGVLVALDGEKSGWPAELSSNKTLSQLPSPEGHCVRDPLCINLPDKAGSTQNAHDRRRKA